MLKKVIVIFVVLLLSTGCSWFADKRVVIKPKPIDTASYEFRWVLSILIKQRYETDMSIEEIARWLEADVAYQEYLQENADR